MAKTTTKGKSTELWWTKNSGKKSTLSSTKKKNSKYIMVAANSRTRSAAEELSDLDTIYMLGEKPVYIHSKENNFDRGLSTVFSDIEKIYNIIKTKTITRARNVLLKIETKEKDIIRLFKDAGINNVSTIEDVCNILTMTYNKDGENSAKVLINKLNTIKRLITIINGLQKNNLKKEKVDKIYQYLTKQITSGELLKQIDDVISVDSDKVSAAFKEELQNLRDTIIGKDKLPIGTLIYNIGHVLEVHDDKLKHTIFNSADKVISNNLDLSFTTYNVAQEKLNRSGAANNNSIKSYIAKESSKVNKTDNLILFNVGSEVKIPAFTSDKTGMEFIDGKILKTFTSSLAAKSLFDTRVETESSIEEIADTQSINALNYVMVNSIYFKSSNSIKARTLIAATYYWNRIFVKILGTSKIEGQYPTFIRNFGTYYPMSSMINYILKAGENITNGSEVNNTNIVTGASDFINYSKSIPERYKKDKSIAIRKIIRAKDKMLDYKTLKQELSSKIPKNYSLRINLKIRIALDNMGATI